MAPRKRSKKTQKSRGRKAPAGQQRQSAPATGAQWIYGQHAVTAAILNPRRNCRRLITTREFAAPFRNNNRNIDVEIVEKPEIEAVVLPGAVHQGVALLADPLPPVVVEDISARAEENQRMLVVALDQVTDTQNIGAIIRSAEAFGAEALLVPDRHTPEISGAITKAASGAVESVSVIRTPNLVRALKALKSASFWVLGLDVDAPVSLAEADFPDKCVLTLGAEGKGLRRLTRETCDMTASIPMSGETQSLNVSASAAVALYEWNRGN